MTANRPILYTYRRCPYAIRARMALRAAKIAFDAIEISFRDKPKEMLAASPKGTVPVLVLSDGTVIDESYDIMKWALAVNDPLGWMPSTETEWIAIDALIIENDTSFKKHLDDYKYSSRHPETPVEELRERALGFLQQLNERLETTTHLTGNTCSIADIALFPFVRQFRLIDERWFESTKLFALNTWLDGILNGNLFVEVMSKRT